MANVHPVLSDLFFNHDHGIPFDVIKTKEAYDQAILDSAKDFLKCYSKILSCEIPTAEELFSDFLGRL